MQNLQTLPISNNQMKNEIISELTKQIHVIVQSYIEKQYLEAFDRILIESNYSKTLSDRQIQVLRGVYDSKDNKTIATELNISDKTVKFHLTGLYKTFDVENRVQLIYKFKEIAKKTVLYGTMRK